MTMPADTVLQTAASEIVASAITTIDRQATRHARLLAGKTGLDQSALRIGLLRLVDRPLQSALDELGGQERNRWLESQRRQGKLSEAIKLLMRTMGTSRAGVYAAFGTSARWEAKRALQRG